MHKLAPCFALLMLAACSRSNQHTDSGTLQSRLAPTTATADGAAVLHQLELQKQRVFVAVPGDREFSGRMIARPLQPDALAALGLPPDQIAERREVAQREISRYTINGHVQQTDDYLFAVPAGTENQVAQRLLATDAFQYVEPDWTLYPIACPNDTHFGLQWGHQANRMQSCAGWDLHTGDASVSVGICDTGVLTTHEDLQLHRLEGYNAVNQLWESQGGQIGPVHPHGTQTTGCAAANGNNGRGVTGVGWNLSHRMMRVSNVSSGSASLSVLQHAARTAVENGNRVASVSYSGPDNSSNLTTATYIKSIGGLLVWAAGNDNRNLTFGNRDSDDLIVAGATDANDVKASFSAYGIFVDVVAPGVSVATSDSTSTTAYVYASGTSFACPITAGMCALIWSRNPSLTPNQVESVLKTSCDDLGTAGVDSTFGYGRLNTLKSMQNAGGGGSAPVAQFTGSPTSGTAPLAVTFTDQSSNSPTSWSWSFGDGGTSTAQNPGHTYANPGSYTVTLTAANAFGSDPETKTGYINVSPGGSAPVADFVGAPTSGTAPLLVTFTDLSSNSPTAWSWNFGDGGTATAQNPSHSYGSAGSYTVTLTASNAFGSDPETKVGYINVTGGGTEQQVAFDGFESANFSGGTGWSGAWTVAGDVTIRTDGPRSGTRHVRQRASTAVMRRSVDLTGVTGARLVFWARLNSFESGDTARVRVSSNGGGSYSTLKTFVNGEDDNIYRRWEFSIPSSANVVVEFDGIMSSSADYFYVDDIEVRGVR